MASAATTAEDRLRECFGKLVRIVVSDGRQIIGLFECVDFKQNVILSNADEYFPDGETPALDPCRGRKLGTVMIPGAHLRSMARLLDAVESDPSRSGEHGLPARQRAWSKGVVNFMVRVRDILEAHIHAMSRFYTYDLYKPTLLGESLMTALDKAIAEDGLPEAAAVEIVSAFQQRMAMKLVEEAARNPATSGKAPVSITGEAVGYNNFDNVWSVTVRDALVSTPQGDVKVAKLKITGVDEAAYDALLPDPSAPARPGAPS